MIYRVDSLEETKRNPITGKAYDSTWIVFVLNHESYTMLCGSINGCAYALKVSKKYLNWKMSMCDFLSYHDSVGKNIILAASEEDYQSAREEYAGHSCRGPYLRDYEAPILVHSTTTENYQKIMRDGAIKSWNVIKRENHCAETEPISRLLGDPAELRDYILAEMQRELESNQNRYDEVDKIIQHLYEDKIKGNMTDMRFQKLSAGYESEQLYLMEAIEKLSAQIDQRIEKILVHEVEVDDEGKKRQKIEIVYNFIGSVELPKEACYKETAEPIELSKRERRKSKKSA